MAQSLGIMKLFFRGEEIVIKPGGTLRLGGVVSRPQVAGTEVFRSEAMMETEIQVKAILRRGQRVTDIAPANVEGEIQVHCDTGQSFIAENGFRKETMTITASEQSEIDLVFACGTMVEI